ncbi:MAG TPA: hypothetical protein VFV99_03520 [Kofleriaceae bacterium]|nr:hypothetical protein [Kofleriaceae bacterium]
MLVRIAAVVALLSACTGGASSTGIEPITCPPEGTNLTYANFGEELFADTCAMSGCHKSEKPVLTTHAAIKQNASAILDEAVYTDSMPRDRNMPLAQREMLGEWLSCGAP